MADLKRILFTIIALLTMLPAEAQSEMGGWLDVGVTKKFNKRWSLNIESEYRIKENLNKSDRLGLGVGTSFRFFKWLKASLGYDFLYTYKGSDISDGGKKQYDSYWYPRHRAHIDVIGMLKMDRWHFSLRERWVYTYRPEVTVNGTKLSSGATVNKIRSGLGENVLRSRLQVEYDIKGSSLTPFASIEAYNAWELQKMRYSIGTEWDITKHHIIKFYYLYQDRRENNSDDDQIDSHILGLSYNYSF